MDFSENMINFSKSNYLTRIFSRIKFPLQFSLCCMVMASQMREKIGKKKKSLSGDLLMCDVNMKNEFQMEFDLWLFK